MPEDIVDERGAYHPTRGNGNTLKQEMWRMEDGLKEDLQLLRSDIKEDLATQREEFHEYIKDHLDYHLTYRKWIEDQFDTAREERGDLFGYVQDASIDEARKQGALGIIILIIRTVGEHWQLIIAVVLFLWAWMGNLKITLT